MKYRKIGNTECFCSAIGLGCENLENKPYRQIKETIDVSIEEGINIFDVFMPGREIREQIAKAIGSKRKNVMIQGHIGSTDIAQQHDISRDLPTVKRYFEDMLRIFGGYIDFGMIFFVDTEADYQGVFDSGFAEYVQRLKKEGAIGHIGFSSHNPQMAIRVIETGLPEMVMFSINPAFDLYPSHIGAIDQRHQKYDENSSMGISPVRAELYRLCEQKGLGITVMKALGAGKLLSPEHTPFTKPLSVAQCIHYALTRPAVASVMLGCQTPKEVLESIRYFSLEPSECDYLGVFQTLASDFIGSCVYCNHCLPCPSEIDIAAVNKYLDIARLDEENIPASIRSHYTGLAQGGGACTACGSCESRCPFAVPIIKNMAQAARLFERESKTNN